MSKTSKIIIVVVVLVVAGLIAGVLLVNFFDIKILPKTTTTPTTSESLPEDFSGEFADDTMDYMGDDLGMDSGMEGSSDFVNETDGGLGTETAGGLVFNPTDQGTTTEGDILVDLGFPGEGVPSLQICMYAVPVAGSYSEPIYCANNAPNQEKLRILAIEPGNYHIFAWMADTPDSDMVGSWTPAVACGLSVECTDHSPSSITVVAGQTTSGVAIKDWYGDGAGYPSRPSM